MTDEPIVCVIWCADCDRNQLDEPDGLLSHRTALRRTAPLETHTCLLGANDGRTPLIVSLSRGQYISDPVGLCVLFDRTSFEAARRSSD